MNHPAAPQIRIREEEPADAAAIETVTIAAFRDAPHTSHTEQFIVAALRRAGKLSVSLVAEHKGAVVGHVAFSPVEISNGATGWFGLGPVSVTPALQRHGVGARLVRAGLERLRAMGASGCVVLGEPVYYERFGFRPRPELVLPDVPAEYFQALAFAASIPAGVVSYAEEFNAPG